MALPCFSVGLLSFLCFLCLFAASLTAEEPPPVELIQDETAWIEVPSVRTASSRAWRLVRTLAWSDGTREERTLSRYTERASGLHFRDGKGRWRVSSLTPTIATDGSVVYNDLPVRYRFAPSAFSETVVTSKRGGQVSASAVAALAYLDRSTGQRVIIAQPRDVPVQVYEGGVFYEDAFDGINPDNSFAVRRVNADIVYRVSLSGLEQDVVLYGDLPDPRGYRMDPRHTVLLVLTELVGHDPEELARSQDGAQLSTEADEQPLRLYKEEHGAWGLLHNWRASYAFPDRDGVVSLGAGTSGHYRQDRRIRVRKRVLSLDAKTYLSEELPLGVLMKQADYLFEARQAKGSEQESAEGEKDDREMILPRIDGHVGSSKKEEMEDLTCHRNGMMKNSRATA